MFRPKNGKESDIIVFDVYYINDILANGFRAVYGN